MQDFWKSVKIRQSYHEKFDAPFLWDTVYILEMVQNRHSQTSQIGSHRWVKSMTSSDLEWSK